MSKRFVVSAIPTHPFLHYRFFLEFSHRMFKDSELNLLETLESRLNFTSLIIQPFDYKWGAEEPDGRWSGMIGQVKRGEADFAISYMTMTYPRYQVVNFTKPYFTTKMVFFTKAPTLLSPNLYTLLRPFTWQVWTGILLSLIFVASVIYLMSKFRTLPVKQPRLLSTIWFLFGVCIYQSGNFMSSKTSKIRLLIGCWLLAVIVLTPTYSGILTSLLAIPMKEYVAENIEELNEGARTGRIKVGTVAGSVYHQDIMNAPNQKWKYIQKSFQNKKTLASHHADGLQRVLSEKNYAFICSEEIGLYFVRKIGVKQYYGSKDTFYENYNGIVANKNFPLMNEFNNIITKVTESGLITHWYTLMSAIEKYIAENAFPEKDSKKNEAGFGIMLGPFVILFFGYILSTVVLIMEVLMSRILKKTG